MMTFIIVVVLVVIIVSAFGNKQKPQKAHGMTEEEIKQKIRDSIKITVTTSTSIHREKHYDESIIDVSNEVCPIIYSEQDNGLTKYPERVPCWSHRYIYSASELDYATKEQQRFYFVYKTNFLSGVWALSKILCKR